MGEAATIKKRSGGRLPGRRKPHVVGSRREVAKGTLLVILACLAALLVGCAGSQPAQQQAQDPANQPNMIFVLTDDLDFASVRQMPAIGSLLVEGGTSFEKTFASHPVCCPSRATILTGLYDHNHDVKTNT